jgi:outer membrane protein assembly factor BamD
MNLYHVYFSLQCRHHFIAMTGFMKMRIIKQLAGLTFFALLTACSTTTDPADAYKGESPQTIFMKGEKSLRNHSYQEAIKRFEALDVQYPFGRDTETAQLHLIYAYYMSNDYPAAEAAADRFVHAHPTSPHVDYAYYMRGLSNFYQNLGVFERLFAVDLATRDLSQIKKTYADFQELTQRFPNSAYAPAAHQYLIYLRNVLANHELEVADYYYSRQAYVAAADRANLVIRHYEGAPAVPKALVVLIQSYRHLQLTQNAVDAMAVLNYNYPNSTYTKQILENK